jgi:hypothetical protein
LSARMLRAALFVTATTLAAGAAQAAQPRVHDGLYLRLGAGLGYLSDSAHSDALPVFGGEIDGTLTGYGPAGELALGGALSPGVFLGGGLYLQWLPSPKAEDVGWRTAEFDVDFDSAMFWLLGPMVDYYFDATGGLHAQGCVGLAIGSLGEGTGEDLPVARLESQSGTGPGGMLGFGHEWWVAQNWSLGLLGRVSLARFATEEDGVEWSHFVVSPALLFTASLN